MSRDFSLDRWTVRPQRGCIERDGETVRIKPKPMAVLVRLSRSAGEAVTRDELFEAVWPGAVISDATLSQCIVELRQAFGETAKEARVIETIPKVGFRLVPEVTLLDDGAAGPGGALVPPAEREDDPRVAKPGILASIVIMAIFFAVLLYFQDDDGGPQKGFPAVAVLPFVDMSPDQDQGHFADGLTEELINQLAQIDSLAVTGRTSSFQYKGRNQDLREVGATLGVTHVLEGSIRKSADGLRVTAQLIEVEDGFHAWSETFDRPLDDFIQIQEEIATSVATALKIKLNVAPRGSPHGTTSLEAYELALRAMEHHKGEHMEVMRKREEYLLRATEIDPEYAFAWAFLARLYIVGNEKSAWNWRDQSEAWLSRALELDPDSPWVLESAAYVYVAMERWGDAEQTIRKLDELNNTNVGAPQLELLVKSGRAKESLALGERAIRRDPLSRHFQTYLQHAYAMNGRVDEALELSESFYLHERDMVTVIEGMVTAFSHDNPHALTSWLERIGEFPGETNMNARLAGFLPDRAAALDWLRRAEVSTPGDLYAAPAWAAWLGDPELALELMRKAPDLWVFWMPHNAGVRGLPGFKQLVMEAGLVDYWREYGWGDFCRPLGEDDFECI